ncbi:MAG: hypothetical protein ABSC45_04550 [Desulfobaccales bacterium]
MVSSLEATVKCPFCQGLARMEIIDMQVHLSSSGQGSEQGRMVLGGVREEYGDLQHNGKLSSG